jgi:hypothetical protein
MRLSSVVLISLSIVFLLIGLYESIAIGISQAYWSIMLSVAFFFIHIYRQWSPKK